ncbi:helicase HerA-like domain-containing protein [Stenotrophobium rhamnosiphilum]|uniref:Helicase HerA-like C-terminal domain-containing protein n=1 Tax=Stenotrophobium rhamnosiphilum TaxID=2029166 RepID=A0A2T5MCR9_9GAMM|nr:helicase HerA-like domain-containing protein [Stenotrophobium rhamnosiphilum]PTU30374.1 hypothetical protein CJD38_15650 [Stenotrophobium rhamnosiphilum]
MDAKVIAAAQAAFPASNSITLGAVVHKNECNPEPTVGIPLSMMNRHGLIAGATGTGKTKTLQLIAEQLSNAGVPVFLADVKGDVSGIAAAGDVSDRTTQRAKETGYNWRGSASPVEFLSLSGKRGAQLRATVSSFGPLLLSKILGLNDTQTSVLTLVFKYCDDKGLLLLDFSDLRAVLQYLSEDGAAELKDYGSISKQSVSVLLRQMVTLEMAGAAQFFGEPEFDLNDLIQYERDGRGLVSVLELSDVQDKPVLFSTFMLWMLATLYNHLPEVGDIEKPKLVFFFDEAHLLFKDASDALLDEVEKVVRLIRSKGVGIFFVTQNPRDVPQTVLGQLGHKVQHALRAFTPDDEAALKSASRTFPKTEFYDVQETLTTLGIGEALVTVLTAKGVPTPPFATRIVPPATRMGPLTEAELGQRCSTPQVKKYAVAIDRESAREKLMARATGEQAETSEEAAPARKTKAAPAAKEEPSAWDSFIGSPVVKQAARQAARTATSAITRGLMQSLMKSLK